MKLGFTTGEMFVLIAAVCLLISLPLLAAGKPIFWFAAQGIYFLGVALLVWRYFAHYVRG